MNFTNRINNKSTAGHKIIALFKTGGIVRVKDVTTPFSFTILKINTYIYTHVHMQSRSLHVHYHGAWKEGTKTGSEWLQIWINTILLCIVGKIYQAMQAKGLCTIHYCIANAQICTMVDQIRLSQIHLHKYRYCHSACCSRGGQNRDLNRGGLHKPAPLLLCSGSCNYNGTYFIQTKYSGCFCASKLNKIGTHVQEMTHNHPKS